MLDVRRVTRPRPGAGSGKVDARSERWREHRKKVRAEIVDAAFRAIDKRGPEVSLREIAEEAGTAKPKIYRHFNDKSDLFQAIGARLRDMLWAAIFPNINFAVDPVREVVRRSVAEYVSLVDQHPNVLRFMLQGRFPEQSESTVRALNEGREITMAMAEMFNHELREMELDPAALQLAASATFGSASAATDWWLGPDSESPRRMPLGRLRQAPDDDHARHHQRHRRTAGHPPRPGPADPRGCAAARRGELTAPGGLQRRYRRYRVLSWHDRCRAVAVADTTTEPRPHPRAGHRHRILRLGMGIELQQRGVDFLILEKADEVGGTWRDNDYPGCACDIPAHLYSFSFEPKPDWTYMWSFQPEILDYLKGIDRQARAAPLHPLRRACRPRPLGRRPSSAGTSSPRTASEYVAQFLISGPARCTSRRSRTSDGLARLRRARPSTPRSGTTTST